MLGIYDRTLYARKCVVKQILFNIAKDFLEKNHIQGSVNSVVNLGLFHENDLISVMTFGKSRYGRSHQWELLRFCTKLNYHIPGAAGKLLSYFELHY